MWQLTPEQLVAVKKIFGEHQPLNISNEADNLLQAWPEFTKLFVPLIPRIAGFKGTTEELVKFCCENPNPKEPEQFLLKLNAVLLNSNSFLEILKTKPLLTLTTFISDSYVKYNPTIPFNPFHSHTICFILCGFYPVAIQALRKFISKTYIQANFFRILRDNLKTNSPATDIDLERHLNLFFFNSITNGHYNLFSDIDCKLVIDDRKLGEKESILFKSCCDTMELLTIKCRELFHFKLEGKINRFTEIEKILLGDSPQQLRQSKQSSHTVLNITPPGPRLFGGSQETKLFFRNNNEMFFYATLTPETTEDVCGNYRILSEIRAAMRKRYSPSKQALRACEQLLTAEGTKERDNPEGDVVYSSGGDSGPDSPAPLPGLAHKIALPAAAHAPTADADTPRFFHVCKTAATPKAWEANCKSFGRPYYALIIVNSLYQTPNTALNKIAAISRDFAFYANAIRLILALQFLDSNPLENIPPPDKIANRISANSFHQLCINPNPIFMQLFAIIINSILESNNVQIPAEEKAAIKNKLSQTAASDKELMHTMFELFTSLYTKLLENVREFMQIVTTISEADAGCAAPAAGRA